MFIGTTENTEEVACRHMLDPTAAKADLTEPAGAVLVKGF